MWVKVLSYALTGYTAIKLKDYMQNVSLESSISKAENRVYRINAQSKKRDIWNFQFREKKKESKGTAFVYKDNILVTTRDNLEEYIKTSPTNDIAVWDKDLKRVRSEIIGCLEGKNVCFLRLLDSKKHHEDVRTIKKPKIGEHVFSASMPSFEPSCQIVHGRLHNKVDKGNGILYKADVHLDEETKGSPLFDSSGYLVGMMTECNKHGVSYALTSDEIENSYQIITGRKDKPKKEKIAKF